MENMYKIHVPFVVRRDDAGSCGKPSVGWGSKRIDGVLRQIRGPIPNIEA